VFERFTDRARHAVVLAQEEARRLDCNYIGAEHILLGLVAEGDGIAFRALESLGTSLDGVRTRVTELVGRGTRAEAGHIPFTADAKRVLEYSLREALQLRHNYIGTEHILLGLVRPGQDTIATQVLLELGIEHSRVRQAVVELLEGGVAAESVGPPAQLPFRTNPPTPPRGTTCSFCGRDVWDTRYYLVGAHALICQDCVEDSRVVIEDATRRGSEPGALHFPPRVSGDVPDHTSVSLIANAFMEVYGAATQAADMRDRPLEDVESLLPAIEEAGRRHPNMGPVSAAISRIRFRSDDLADVRFTLFGFPFEGRAIRDAGTWKVSRDTFCQTLARGGVQCPPRESR
jgi:hypothetical protein